MTETIVEHDFVELDYTGKLTDGTVFDTTSQDVAKENNLPTENQKFSPATICVGENQILPGLDENLVGKDVGKEYTIKLTPEKAFGKRDIKKMRIVPMSTFKEHQVQPQPGLQIDVDGEMGTVMRVAGGRVIVNFNHPLAGREVVYVIKVNKKITDKEEQLKAFLNTTLRLPRENIKVRIETDGSEEKAVIEIPMDLPPQFTDALGEKLAKLTKLKEIKFKKPEIKS